MAEDTITQPGSGAGGQAAPPQQPSSKRKIVHDVLIKFAADAIVAALVAIAGAVWLYFSKDPTVPVFGALLFVASVVLSTFGAVASVQKFFSGEIEFSGRGRLHFFLVVLVGAMVAAPISIVVSKVHANRSLVQRHRDEVDQMALLLGKVLRKQTATPADVTDILHVCAEAMTAGKRAGTNLRAAVFYPDSTGRFLAVPDGGYYGYKMYQDIRDLYFDMALQADNEDYELYLERLGVAGWCYVNRSSILADDVNGTEHAYRYKVVPELKDQPDRSMICVGIPDLEAPAPSRYIGVLSVSSTDSGVLTEDDRTVAKFFATIFGRYRLTVDTPHTLQGQQGHAPNGAATVRPVP